MIKKIPWIIKKRGSLDKEDKENLLIKKIIGKKRVMRITESIWIKEFLIKKINWKGKIKKTTEIGRLFDKEKQK